MSSTESCCVSGNVSDECHNDLWRAEKILHKINTLSEEDREILKLRVTGLKEIDDQSICDSHYKRYIQFYSSAEWKCCDPYSVHSKSVQNDLHIATLGFSKNVQKICKLSIIPGKKLCKNCQKRLRQQIKDFEHQLNCCADPFKRHRTKVNDHLCSLDEKYINYLKDVCNLSLSSEHKICSVCNEKLILDLSNYEDSLKGPLKNFSVLETLPSKTSTESDNSQSTSSVGSQFQTNSQKKRKLDEVLDALGIPAFKRKKLNEQRLVEKGVSILESAVLNITGVFEDAHDVKLPKYTNLEEMSFESSSFKKMILNMQSTYNTSSTDKKIAMLTLLPADWKYKQYNQYFKCSHYMINEANKLRAKKGMIIILHAIYHKIIYICSYLNV